MVRKYANLHPPPPNQKKNENLLEIRKITGSFVSCEMTRNLQPVTRSLVPE